MNDGKKVLIGIFAGIIVAQIIFGVQYVIIGWDEIILHYTPDELKSLKNFLTVIFVVLSIVIFIAVSFYYLGAPSNRIKEKSFYGWLLMTIGAILFYILTIIFINTDLLQYLSINLFLIIPLIISWFFISISIGYMLSESEGGSAFIKLFHFLFLVILIARVVVHLSK